eukprot:GEMP01049063.1.p1 GENE.GEMP01049063.1~~GEMP01049063.1.p1  ORF type:complete len:329 (-),score=76.53 GEMP01049063.1:690-1637(-)
MKFPETRHQLDEYFKNLPAPWFTNDNVDVGLVGTYGEITAEGVHVLLQYAIRTAASSRAIRTFVDLGSGIGKACIAAALYGPETLERCLGIELSEERTQTAQSALQTLKESAPLTAQQKLSKVEFTAGDFFEYAVAWIARADVIWISNVCFPQEVNERLSVLIDAFAREECIVFASCPLLVERKATVGVPLVSIPQSWQPAHEALVYRIVGAPKRRIKWFASPKCHNFRDACERAFAFWALFDACSLDKENRGTYVKDVLNAAAPLPADRVHSAVVDALFHLTDAVTLACHTPLAQVAVHLQLLRPAFLFWPFCC